MNRKKITMLVCLSFFIGLFCSIAVPSKASDNSIIAQGYYVLQPHKFYEQNLGNADGLCVEGVNSAAGQTTDTDYIASGNWGYSDWTGLEIWNTEYPVGTPAHQSEHDDVLFDMAKIEDSSGNMDLIYIQAGTPVGTSENRIVRQSIVGQSNFKLTEDWDETVASYPLDLTLGEFSSDSDVEAAVFCENGEVYIIRNMNTGSKVTITLLDQGFPSFYYNRRYRTVKNIITNIGDLDADTSYSDEDIVVGRYQNVTAISNKNSNQKIWDVKLLTSGYICSVLAVEDQNADTIDDIVVGTSSSGIYLLSGADGSTLQHGVVENMGSILRDVQIFNSTHVITGNSNGDIHVWDLATGTNAISANIGHDVNVILDVGDFHSDGYHEFAIGGDSYIGVFLGNNLTEHWATSPRGNAWGGSPIDVFDLCIMDDMVDSYGTIGNTDGYGDLGVIGHIDDESALFIYNTHGAWQFIPNLVGSGYIVGGGSCFEDGYVEFSATASQKLNLPITAEIIIDGTHIALTPDSSDWDGGVSYSYSDTFSEGEHSYDFTFTDGTDTYPAAPNDRTFQIGNCGGGGLDIPGAGVWMILSSIVVGLAISLLLVRKRLRN